MITAICVYVSVCVTAGGVCMNYHTVYLWRLPADSHRDGEQPAYNCELLLFHQQSLTLRSLRKKKKKKKGNVCVFT